jgi:hypothetical protein
VDDEAGGEIESGCDAGLAGRTADSGTDFFDLAAGLLESRAGGAVDGAVNTPAAEELLVGGVDDGVDVQLRDIGSGDLDWHVTHFPLKR